MFRASTLIIALLCAPASVCVAQPTAAPVAVSSSTLRDEVTDFLGKELAAHLGDIKSYETQPDKVLAAGSTGEYTWGTFMNALGAYARLSGAQRLADRD